ncbi:transmembrane protein [Cystoisospora suis]|uniref:Transmembrane protein n=1 Tax=Cystoisospora suis TaxID=483139 RepID=A0A2C6L080_9APIC|nr:transmembrane protein [Cystoisospora suis]
MAGARVVPLASLTPSVPAISGELLSSVARECCMSLRRLPSSIPATGSLHTSGHPNCPNSGHAEFSLRGPILPPRHVLRCRSSSCKRASLSSPRLLVSLFSSASFAGSGLPFLRTSRFFSTLDKAGRASAASPRQTSTWLEVERVRPQVPSAFDGSYQWPEAAPNPLDIKRENFHAFMHGKTERFSRELKVFLYGWGCVVLMGSLVGGTIWVMTPDDFEWVEEERMRMEQAKRKKASAELALSAAGTASETSLPEKKL